MQKTNRKNSAVKLGLAAASALALTLGGVSSAYAADINVGPDDVAGFEVGGAGTEPGFNYDQWHVGNVDTPGTPTDASLTFGECSVTTLAAVERDVTQVLKGFPVDGRPSTQASGTTAELEAIVNSTSITVVEGSVTIQVPVFLYYNGELSSSPDFTTFRTLALGPGTHNLADLTITDSQWGFSDMTFAELFGYFQDEIDNFDDIFQILGVGFTGSEGAVVESLSFSGDTYYFGTGDCAPAASTPSAPTPPKEVQTAAA